MILALGNGNKTMADPIVQMELDEINEERKALGLAPLTDIAEARKWNAGPKEKAEPETEETAAPAEVDKDGQGETVKPADAEIPVAAAPVGGEAVDVQALKSEIQELKGKLQSARTEEGRVSKLDKLLKEAVARAEAAEARAEQAEAKAEEFERKAKGGGIRSYLTPEQLEAVDDGLLEGFDKALSDMRKELMRGAKEEVGSTRELLQQRIDAEEKRAAEEAQNNQRLLQQRISDMWRDKIAPVIPAEVYGKFQGNPKWALWSGKAYAGTTRGAVFNSAVASLDHDAAIEQLQNFMAFAGIEVPAKGTKPPLRVDESNGQQTVDSGQNKPRTYFADAVKPVYDGFFKGSRLPSGWTQKQFMDWADEIDLALSQGRVVERNTGKPVMTL